LQNFKRSFVAAPISVENSVDLALTEFFKAYPKTVRLFRHFTSLAHH